MAIYREIIERLRKEAEKMGGKADLMRHLGAVKAPFYRAMAEKNATAPNSDTLCAWLDSLGAKIVFPDDSPKEASQDVCFVNAQLVQATDGVAPPQAVDYIAAPMVGEVGAGLGYIPQDEVKSWFLVYKNLDAVRYRRNLIAVQIGKNSTSMQPLLNPLDIVLVDRDDRDVTSPGHIMLVKDSDGSGMIKRVSVDETKNGDFSVVYYSDNATKNPPICYSLKTDFLGEWDNAIVGRVIWAWSDVREK